MGLEQFLVVQHMTKGTSSLLKNIKSLLFPVVCPDNETSESLERKSEAYTGEGNIINSDFLNGLSVSEAKDEATNLLISI